MIRLLDRWFCVYPSVVLNDVSSSWWLVPSDIVIVILSVFFRQRGTKTHPSWMVGSTRAWSGIDSIETWQTGRLYLLLCDFDKLFSMSQSFFYFICNMRLIDNYCFTIFVTNELLSKQVLRNAGFCSSPYLCVITTPAFE